jgi:RNA-directed DNA polymerase
MASLTRFVERRLKLQINTEKSAVARPWHRSFLGFTVKDDPAFRRCIAEKAVTRFKERVRDLTRRHRGVSLEKMIADLNPFVRGWAGYFGFSQWRELPSLDGWIRRHLRCVAWVQWKTRGQRYRELRRLKVPERSASAAIFSPKGPWRLSFSEALHRASCAHALFWRGHPDQHDRRRNPPRRSRFHDRDRGCRRRQFVRAEPGRRVLSRR